MNRLASGRENELRYMKQRVILLNGPSSSGKSTLAAALKELIRDKSTERYDVVSIDDFLQMTSSETIYEDDVFNISDHLCKRALEVLETGAGVIIDHVITSERIYTNLRENLDSFGILKVRVSCSLPLLRIRERERGDRSPGSAEASEKYLFPKEGYDVVVDSGKKSPAANAILIFNKMIISKCKENRCFAFCSRSVLGDN